MRRLGLVALVGGLALTGCGGGESGSSGSGGDSSGGEDVAACDIVSNEDVSSAFDDELFVGETFDGPRGPDPTGCTFTNDSGDRTILVQTYFGKKYYGGIDSPARQDPVAIDDLGDDAFADNGSVVFLSGEWTGSVSSIAGQIPDADLEAIARVLEANLP